LALASYVASALFADFRFPMNGKIKTSAMKVNW
jgi:hypothetical protein